MTPSRGQQLSEIDSASERALGIADILFLMVYEAALDALGLALGLDLFALSTVLRTALPASISGDVCHDFIQNPPLAERGDVFGEANDFLLGALRQNIGGINPGTVLSVDPLAERLDLKDGGGIRAVLVRPLRFLIV